MGVRVVGVGSWRNTRTLEHSFEYTHTHPPTYIHTHTHTHSVVVSDCPVGSARHHRRQGREGLGLGVNDRYCVRGERPAGAGVRTCWSVCVYTLSCVSSPCICCPKLSNDTFNSPLFLSFVLIDRSPAPGADIGPPSLPGELHHCASKAKGGARPGPFGSARAQASRWHGP